MLGLKERLNVDQIEGGNVGHISLYMTDCKVTVNKVIYISSCGMEGLCRGVHSFPFFFLECSGKEWAIRLKGAGLEGLEY